MGENLDINLIKEKISFKILVWVGNKDFSRELRNFNSLEKNEYRFCYFFIFV